jgi:hypothetical protein
MPIKPLQHHSQAFAARGFARSLTQEQRAAFMAMFAEPGQRGTILLEAVMEQITFDRDEGAIPRDEALLLSALDYALPRMSSAVTWIADDIETNWGELSECGRLAIRQRIATAATTALWAASDERRWSRIASLPVNAAESEELKWF